MSLSLDDVRRIARLARIEITPTEAEDVRSKLDGIFELIGRMRAVDTEGVEPMSHALDAVLSVRDDRVTETNRREDYLRVAPAVEAGLYLVPKVIE